MVYATGCSSIRAASNKLYSIQLTSGVCVLRLYAARQLLATIHRHGRLDFDCAQPDPRFNMDMLFTKGPGRMIGEVNTRLSGIKSNNVVYAFDAPSWASSQRQQLMFTSYQTVLLSYGSRTCLFCSLTQHAQPAGDSFTSAAHLCRSDAELPAHSWVKTLLLRCAGVLVAVDGERCSHVLKAFSGQITETWHIPGMP
jgi:hypothetical protein